MAEAMSKACRCSGPHQQMMGQGKALKDMQNYEPGLVKLLGDAIYMIYSAMEVAWHNRGQAELMMMEMVEKSTEEMKYLEQNKELVRIGGQEALKAISMLHRQLGHPSAQRLVAACKERDFPKEFIQVARQYKCPTCWSKQEPKAVRVATLKKAPHFNHTVAIDTFYIEWDGEKKAVLTILDEYSRYEMDHPIVEETAEMEIALLESSWMRSFGFPTHLRLDASGPHQSSTFADWASTHGMKLELIPRKAHHRLGILERNHAVRRKLLEIFHKEMPDVPFDRALVVTCHQRNRLASVSGASPATLAFAYVPSEGGNADEPGPECFGDERDQVKNTLIKEHAAVAFHKANADLAMRSAILARSRVEQDELSVGDWCSYWKPAATKLDPYRWRGPCLVVAIEKKKERDNVIYWVVHGSSLVRCTRNQLRHESVPERFERQSQPSHLEQLRQPLPNRLLKALRPVRGPVRAVDISVDGQDPFEYHGGYASNDAADSSGHFFESKGVIAKPDTKTPTLKAPDDETMEPAVEPTGADTPTPPENNKESSTPSPEDRPLRRIHPIPERVETELASIWSDPGPPGAATTTAPETTATEAADPSTGDDDMPSEERRGPGILEKQDDLHPHLPATQANAMHRCTSRPCKWQVRSPMSGTGCLMDFQHAAKETDSLHLNSLDWRRSTWCR